MATARYYVTDNGADSTVTDSITGQIVFVGPYDKALSQAAELNRQASNLYNQKTTVVSSGSVVRDDQVGYGNKSNPQDPVSGPLVLQNGRIQPPPDTTAGTNALPPVGTPNNVNWGTNGSVRPYSQTQATGGPALGLLASPGPASPRPAGDAAVAVTTTQQGVGASNDDSGKPNTGSNTTVSQLNQIDYGTVTPQPNILDQYASYTYQASLYLISADNYKRMVDTNEKNLADAQLLVQTGGGAQVGRSDFFKLDYYIDDIEIQSAFAANGGTRLAHNAVDVNFTVVEPTGISFIQNLDKAVQQFLGGPENKKNNYASQTYLMVIRFYGYDNQGNLVRGGVNTPKNISDPNAFVEKWFPLVIKDIKFRVASKVVEYQIKAAVLPYYVGGSSAYGTIPFNIELSGQTIKDILAGPAVYAATQNAVSNTAPSSNQSAAETNRLLAAATAAAAAAAAPPKANAATSAKKTVRQGLMSALNEHQQTLVAQKTYTYPDTYEVEFAIDALASAKVINPAGLNLGATSMSTPGTAADQKLGSKQSMDPQSRIQGATAGMQIVQFIDNLLRNSTYIKDQQVVVNDEKTGARRSTGINIANTSWYKISFSATNKQYDPLRNDYAKHIKYTISPFKIAQLNSPYFKQPQYTGSHKQYVYWFTGENEAVIDYEEHLDHLYYTVLSGAGDASETTSSALEILKFQYQTASGQSNMGGDNNVNEPGANAADQLYSPTDLGDCNLTIVGDPAWMAQGEASVGLNLRDQFYFQPFLADGTINFDSQNVLFEIGYNTTTDYNLYTGLSELDKGSQSASGLINSATQTHSPTKVSRVYIAKRVFSYFKKGKFTQLLKGKLRTFYTPKELAEQGRTATTPATQTKKINTPAPAWNPKSERSSVTNPTPTSSLAKGVQQILTPAVQADTPSLSQLQASPVYIQARRNGATAAAALEAAKSSFAAGTNNAANFAAPGIRTGPQQIVREP